MDPRTISGFLGTNASRASDISLLAYVFLFVPGMLIGFAFARRRIFVYHQWIMTSIVLINWFLIVYIMIETYSTRIAPNLLTQGISQIRVWLPSLHLLLGLSAQIIATFLVFQMWLGPLMPLRLRPIKTWMRLTLGLWLLTAVLGVTIYLRSYGAPFSKVKTPTPLVATQEATRPESSTAAPEATSPVQLTATGVATLSTP